MVAYSYKPRFVQPIITGRKPGTIRAPRAGRSRHARPGEALQFYTGMRTKYCKLFARGVCERLRDVQMIFSRPGILSTVRVDGEPWPQGLDHFAQLDGFDDFVDMAEFWQAEHPEAIDFRGVWIIHHRNLEVVL